MRKGRRRSAAEEEIAPGTRASKIFTLDRGARARALLIFCARGRRRDGPIKRGREAAAKEREREGLRMQLAYMHVIYIGGYIRERALVSQRCSRERSGPLGIIIQPVLRSSRSFSLSLSSAPYLSLFSLRARGLF